MGYGGSLRPARCWKKRAFEATAACDLVFMDPDNGIAPNSVTPMSNAAPKYVFVGDIAPYITRGQSLVIYHHQTREKGGLSAQIEAKFAILHSLGVERPFALVFRRMSVRIYFVAPAPARDGILGERARRFIDTLCGRRRHFELVGLAAATGA